MSERLYSFLAGTRECVRCPTCNSDVAENAKFCTKCGIPLQGRCPNCFYDNRFAAKFCIVCGAALTPIAFASETLAADSGSAPETRSG